MCARGELEMDQWLSRLNDSAHSGTNNDQSDSDDSDDDSTISGNSSDGSMDLFGGGGGRGKKGKGKKGGGGGGGGDENNNNNNNNNSDQSSNVLQFRNARMSGMLRKMSRGQSSGVGGVVAVHGNGSWKDRFFVLDRGGTLSYYAVDFAKDGRVVKKVKKGQMLAAGAERLEAERLEAGVGARGKGGGGKNKGKIMGKGKGKGNETTETSDISISISTTSLSQSLGLDPTFLTSHPHIFAVRKGRDLSVIDQTLLPEAEKQLLTLRSSHISTLLLLGVTDRSVPLLSSALDQLSAHFPSPPLPPALSPDLVVEATSLLNKLRQAEALSELRRAIAASVRFPIAEATARCLKLGVDADNELVKTGREGEFAVCFVLFLFV